MITDQYQDQDLADLGWPHNPTWIPHPTGPGPTSSAAKHTAAVREDEQAHRKQRNQVVDQLQARRQRREAERARLKGLSTADILAARRLGTG